MAVRVLKFNFVAFVTSLGKTRGLNSLSVPMFTVLWILHFFSSHCVGFKLVAVTPTSSSSGVYVLLSWVLERVQCGHNNCRLSQKVLLA